MQNDTQIIKIIKYPRESGEYLHFGTYQREYCWGKKECLEFIHSLEMACNESTKIPMGSLSSYYMKDKDHEESIEIVDGQQRLTTFSLFVLALYYITDNDIVKDNCKDCLFNINNSPLIHFDYNEENNDAYESILYDNEISIKDNKISKNYLFFLNYLKTCKYSHIQLWNGLRKLVVFEMQCESKREALLLFTSINGYGKKVQSHEQIIPLIELYLEQLEGDCNEQKVLEIYNSIKYKIISDKNLISNFAYVVFKESIIYSDILNYLENLLKKIDFIEFIYTLSDYCSWEDNYIKYVNEICKKENLHINMYILKPEFKRLIGDLYGKWKKIENELSQKELIEVIRFYEKCSIRQTIVGVRAISSHIFKLDYAVEKACKKQIETNKTFCESFQEIIKEGACNEFIYPKNEVVESNLETKDWYKSMICRYLLITYNNYLTKGEMVLDENLLTIEHIIPQSSKLPNVHKLGNLTLLSDIFNKKASNKSFADKKETYKNSQLMINSYLKEIDDFTSEDIINRTKEISKILIENVL